MAAEIGRPITRQRAETPNIFQYANNKRKEKTFNDVTIKVGNHLFPANRMILSCCSEIFEKIFLSEMTEKYKYEIKVKDVDPKSMHKIINFMYTGSVTIDDETDAMNLLSAAEYFQLNELKGFCSEFLESFITSDSCFVVLKVADMYRCDDLKEKSNQFISSNLNVLALTMDFKTLSMQEIKSCFSNLDRSKLPSENCVYEALITWIKHDEQSRQREVHDLLQFVDFSKFSFDYLNDVVLSESLITESKQSLPNLMNSLAEINKRHTLKAFGSKIISIGGDKTSKKVLEIFEFFDEAPTQYPELPLSTIQHCSLYNSDVVFCVGGRGKTLFKAYNHTWKMKLNKESLNWEKAAPMLTARSSFSAVYFQNHIVASGGWGKKKAIKSTEVYSFPFDEWRPVCPLQTSRFAHCLTECKGRLFAFGGTDRKLKCLSSVEKLNGLKSKWTYVKPMLTARRWFAAVSLNGCIFAIAGYNESRVSTLKSVEKYDVAADEWSYVQDLNKERTFHSACVLQDKIYVVGGKDANDVCVKEIECYDPETNTWSIVAQTMQDLCNHSLVVV